MDERLQLGSQAFDGVGDTHPPALPDLVFEPVVELSRHPHDINIDATDVVALSAMVTADGVACDDAAEASLLLGFADRRLTRTFAVVD